jgi:hypothetical protein
MLSREEMEAAIKDGRSVSLAGTVYSTLEKLPSARHIEAIVTRQREQIAARKVALDRRKA